MTTEVQRGPDQPVCGLTPGKVSAAAAAGWLMSVASFPRKLYSMGAGSLFHCCIPRAQNRVWHPVGAL